MASNSRNLGKLLGTDTKIKTDDIAGSVQLGLSFYTNEASLPTEGNILGAKAYAELEGTLWLWNGIGWGPIAITAWDYVPFLYFANYPIGLEQTLYGSGAAKAGNFDRTADFGYTSKVWTILPTANGGYGLSAWDDINNYWTILETVTDTWFGSNTTGSADNGIELGFCNTSGETRFINKTTKQVTVGPTVTFVNLSGVTTIVNLQGMLWDGSNFWCASYNNTTSFYKISSDYSTYTPYTLPSLSPNIAARAAAYDYTSGWYYIAGTGNLRAYTFDGTTFTIVVNDLDYVGTADDFDMLAMSANERYLIRFDGFTFPIAKTL